MAAPEAPEAPQAHQHVVFEHGGEVHEVGPCPSEALAHTVRRLLQAKSAGVEHGPAASASFGRVVQQLKQCCKSLLKPEAEAHTWSVAHLASMQGHAPVVQLLLLTEPEATLSQADSCGLLPLHYAARRQRVEVVGLLLQAPGGAAAAMTAAARGGLPLHCAARNGNIEVARMLLAAAPEAVMWAGPSGFLPLHAAVGGGHAAMVQLLLEHAPQAAVARYFFGRFVALHDAAHFGHVETVRVLLRAAPETAFTPDNHGNLPVHLAAFYGHVAALECLLEAAPASAAVLARGRSALGKALRRLLQHQKPECEGTVRALAAFSPAEAALTTLAAAGAPAHYLMADCVAAHLPLSEQAWQLVPAACPGLGRALPAALEASAAQAAQLVHRLPPADAQGLRTFALCLARAQRKTHVALPPEVAGKLMALFDS